MIDMASSGANDGIEQKGGIIDDSLGIGYESRMCEARPDFLSILRRADRASFAWRLPSPLKAR
jgi:hypothetical protein